MDAFGSARSETSLVEVDHVSKAYPGVAALVNVSVQFYAGEVHALVGENGAGKSTLMKVVGGAVAQDSGKVSIAGRLVPPGQPAASASAGFAMIYQELTTAPDMSAARNVFLGNLPQRFGVIDRRQMRERFAELAREVGVDFAPDLPAGQLSVAGQQLLEVMRALAEDRQVVVFDEPTACLGPGDRAHLHEVVRRLRARERAVIYISHDLEEVLTLSDRITVMREGQIVRTGETTKWTKATLVRSMLGRSIADPLPRRRTDPVGAVPLFQVRNVTAANGQVQVRELSLHAGEILGIGGLVGSGRTELLKALSGADPSSRGDLSLDGASRRWPRSVTQGLGYGIAMVPEDRKRDGLCLTQPAFFNILLGDLAAPARYGWFGPRHALAASAGPAAAAGFDSARLRHLAGSLSGGNQQKLLLARWMHRRPRILVLDEPTRGIDIGAKRAVFTTIRQLAEAGMAVIMVSSDLEEIVAHADRILVLARGRLVSELPSPTTVEAILGHAFGVSTPHTGVAGGTA